MPRSPGLRRQVAGPTEAQLNQWDGRLPLATQDPITTGGPTIERSTHDPRTWPAAVQLTAHITSTGASGSYDVILGAPITVNVGDLEADIQATLDGLAPGMLVATGDWDNWVLSAGATGVLMLGGEESAEGLWAALTVDDALLVGGTAAVAVTNGDYSGPGLVRPVGSLIVFEGLHLTCYVDGDGMRFWIPEHRYVQTSTEPLLVDYTLVNATVQKFADGACTVQFPAGADDAAIPFGTEIVFLGPYAITFVASDDGDLSTIEGKDPISLANGRVVATKTSGATWHLNGDLADSA